VEGNGSSPAELIVCGRCQTACQSSDRFCRQCGLYLHESQVPSLWDEPKSPVPWRPASTGLVVRGAAIVAVGTVAEILLRRLVRGILSGDGGKPEPAKEMAVVPQANGNGHSEAEVVTETLLFRRIRFRR
jgi:hypothetical protein